jgi:P-type conjugative transfer protein TrbL
MWAFQYKESNRLLMDYITKVVQASALMLVITHASVGFNLIVNSARCLALGISFTNSALPSMCSSGQNLMNGNFVEAPSLQEATTATGATVPPELENGLDPWSLFVFGIRESYGNLLSKSFVGVITSNYITNPILGPVGSVVDSVFGLVVMFLAATAVFSAFVLLALELLGVTMEAALVGNLGIVMLGFLGSRWTNRIGSNYITYGFSVAIRIFVIYIFVGVGEVFFYKFENDILNNNQITLPETASICAVAFALFYMVKRIDKFTHAFTSGQSSFSGLHDVALPTATTALGVATVVGGAAAGGATLVGKLAQTTNAVRAGRAFSSLGGGGFGGGGGSFGGGASGPMGGAGGQESPTGAAASLPPPSARATTHEEGPVRPPSASALPTTTPKTRDGATSAVPPVALGGGSARPDGSARGTTRPATPPPGGTRSGGWTSTTDDESGLPPAEENEPYFASMGDHIAPPMSEAAKRLSEDYSPIPGDLDNPNVMINPRIFKNDGMKRVGASQSQGAAAPQGAAASQGAASAAGATSASAFSSDAGESNRPDTSTPSGSNGFAGASSQEAPASNEAVEGDYEPPSAPPQSPQRGVSNDRSAALEAKLSDLADQVGKLANVVAAVQNQRNAATRSNRLQRMRAWAIQSAQAVGHSGNTGHHIPFEHHR